MTRFPEREGAGDGAVLEQWGLMGSAMFGGDDEEEEDEGDSWRKRSRSSFAPITQRRMK
jgi:hypothetical protein